MPYLEYPQLLGVLLRMLSEGTPVVRREVMKVLGIIGALDPHTHKVGAQGGGVHSSGLPQTYRLSRLQLRNIQERWNHAAD